MNSVLAIALLAVGVIAAIGVVAAFPCRQSPRATNNTTRQRTILTLVLGVFVLLLAGFATSQHTFQLFEESFHGSLSDHLEAPVYHEIVFSVLGLVATILLLYTFLNASTLGRMAWPARGISLALLAALYLAIAYMRGWFGYLML